MQTDNTLSSDIVKKLLFFVRWSLAFLWLWTAACSVWDMPTSLSLLHGLDWADGTKRQLVCVASAWDALLGVWLMAGVRLRLCYAVQLLTVLLFTALATWLVPAAWLHPFGMLSKNVPIGALMYVAYTLHNE